MSARTIHTIIENHRKPIFELAAQSPPDFARSVSAVDADQCWAASMSFIVQNCTGDVE